MRKRQIYIFVSFEYRKAFDSKRQQMYMRDRKAKRQIYLLVGAGPLLNGLQNILSDNVEGGIGNLFLKRKCHVRKEIVVPQITYISIVQCVGLGQEGCIFY